jgi:hypothetical protein
MALGQSSGKSELNPAPGAQKSGTLGADANPKSVPAGGAWPKTKPSTGGDLGCGSIGVSQKPFKIKGS